MEVSAERGDTIVHTVSCGSFDLGSLLGTGNVFGLGDFASSESALKEARKCHDNAIRCVDCCIEDLIPHDTNDQIAHLAKNQGEVGLKRKENNIAPSIRNVPQQAVPGPYTQMTNWVTEFSKDKPGQYPAVFLA
jgi:hypothetical protein